MVKMMKLIIGIFCFMAAGFMICLACNGYMVTKSIVVAVVAVLVGYTALHMVYTNYDECADYDEEEDYE